jgi:hypothetical protein
MFGTSSLTLLDVPSPLNEKWLLKTVSSALRNAQESLNKKRDAHAPCSGLFEVELQSVQDGRLM